MRVTLSSVYGGAVRPVMDCEDDFIDPNGSPITQLEHGQRKAISSDRVILRPGPSTQTKIVKRIFNSLVSGRTFSEIANDLNGDNIRNGRARPWSTQTIIKILENEAYIGSAVYNRTSFKLREKAVINPPEMWNSSPQRLSAGHSLLTLSRGHP